MTDRRHLGERAAATRTAPPAWLQAPWRHRPLLKFLAVWLIASPLGALATYGLLFPVERRLDALDRRGVQTTGVVTRAHPGHDGDISVRFRVAGVEYELGDDPRPPNRPAADLRVGERIAVTYDREHPVRACACQPQLVGRTPPGIGFLLWFAAGAVGVVGYVTHRRRSLLDRAGSMLRRLATRRRRSGRERSPATTTGTPATRPPASRPRRRPAEPRRH